MAVNVLFYELTNPIRKDLYVGFPIHKFQWSSNITYYNVLKFSDDPTVGLSITILIKWRTLMELGLNDRNSSIGLHKWNQGIQIYPRNVRGSLSPRAAAGGSWQPRHAGKLTISKKLPNFTKMKIAVSRTNCIHVAKSNLTEKSLKWP